MKEAGPQRDGGSGGGRRKTEIRHTKERMWKGSNLVNWLILCVE